MGKEELRQAKGMGGRGCPSGQREGATRTRRGGGCRRTAPEPHPHGAGPHLTWTRMAERRGPGADEPWVHRPPPPAGAPKREARRLAREAGDTTGCGRGGTGAGDAVEAGPSPEFSLQNSATYFGRVRGIGGVSSLEM
jgi:hypothetical protein